MKETNGIPSTGESATGDPIGGIVAEVNRLVMNVPQPGTRVLIRDLTIARVQAVQYAKSTGFRREDLTSQIVEVNTSLIYLGYPKARLAVFTDGLSEILTDLRTASNWGEDGLWKGAA